MIDIDPIARDVSPVLFSAVEGLGAYSADLSPVKDRLPRSRLNDVGELARAKQLADGGLDLLGATMKALAPTRPTIYDDVMEASTDIYIHNKDLQESDDLEIWSDLVRRIFERLAFFGSATVLGASTKLIFPAVRSPT